MMATGRVLFTATITITFFLTAAVLAADEDEPDPQSKMYKILRNLALPGSDKEDVKIQQRFVMQIPGKLLNPNDYDSTNHSKDKNVQRYTAEVAPKIDENKFRLTDITPAADPMKAGETGDSFVEAYENVLNLMYVRDYDDTKREMYDEAIQFLGEKVKDPYGTEEASRFEMYKKLQEQYNKISLEMEDKIESKRKELEKDPVSFQIWFQNNYPSMQANVENAYTDWIVFGQKDLVESYKQKLDVSSTGTILGKAKSLLRGSGKPTLDRASTYYPVHFEPSNWYEYLRPLNQHPTREEIQMRIGDLNAKLMVLKGIRNSKDTLSESTKNKLKKLSETSGASTSKIYSTLKKFLEAKIDCYSREEKSKEKGDQDGQGDQKGQDSQKGQDGQKGQDSQKGQDNQKGQDGQKGQDSQNGQKGNGEQGEASKEASCRKFHELQTELSSLSGKYAVESAELDSVKFQLLVGEESENNLKILEENLKEKKENLEKTLNTAKWPDISESSDDDFEKRAQDIKNGWMEFEYTYSRQTKEKESESYNVDTSAKSRFSNIWGVSGGGSYSRSSSDFSESFKSSDVRIHAKVLKVTIKKPWFKSGLFKNELIKMKAEQKVSPGPNTEKNYIDSIKSDKFYMLPEFVSAFLLAKDVEMEFTGVDSVTKAHTVAQSASGSLSGSYFVFSASASFSYGNSKSSLQTETTAEGLKIKIPGAQLIGYYTTLLPCFPRGSPGCE